MAIHSGMWRRAPKWVGRAAFFPGSAAAAAAKSRQSCLTVRPHRRQPTRPPRPWDSPGKNTGVGCHFLQRMKVKSESEVAPWYPTPSDPMDCSSPGSSVHGIFQTRVLEWGAIAFSLAVLGRICFLAFSRPLESTFILRLHPSPPFTPPLPLFLSFSLSLLLPFPLLSTTVLISSLLTFTLLPPSLKDSCD